MGLESGREEGSGKRKRMGMGNRTGGLDRMGWDGTIGKEFFLLLITWMVSVSFYIFCVFNSILNIHHS